MSQVFSSIGGALGKVTSMGGGKLLPAIGTGVGFLNNWLNSRKQNDIYSTLRDPKKMNDLIAQYERPLSGGLTKAVGNQSQAFLAERGLGESPTIAAEVQAQAMAPFAQQQQQQAIQLALQSLGLAEGAIPKGTDMTSLLKMLMTPGAHAGMPSPGSAPDPTNVDFGPGIIPEVASSPSGSSGSTGLDFSTLLDMFGGGGGGGTGDLSFAGGF